MKPETLCFWVVRLSVCMCVRVYVCACVHTFVPNGMHAQAETFSDQLVIMCAAYCSADVCVSVCVGHTGEP